MAIAIAGFGDDAKHVRLSEAELVTRVVQDALGAAGQVSVTRLDDAARLLAIARFANPGGAMKQIDEAMKSHKADLFLFASDVHRNADGAVDISLDVMTFPDRACTGSKLIRGLKLPVSVARPETVLMAAARQFLRTEKQSARLVIQPTRLDGRPLTAKSGRWFEEQLKAALVSAQPFSLGDPVTLEIAIARDTPMAGDADDKTWRAEVNLVSEPQHVALLVAFSKAGQTTGAGPEPIATNDLRNGLDIENALLTVTALKRRIAAPPKPGSGETLRFEIKFARDLNLYCFADVPSKQGSYAIFPPRNGSSLLAATSSPVRYPEGLKIPPDLLNADEPGRTRLTCFGLAKPPPKSVLDAWKPATLQARLDVITAKGIPETSPDFDRHLMLSPTERAALAKLLKDAGAEEAGAEVEIVKP
ncbi:MAG TPA: hypothetical protein PK264_06485 [Hyphomicrobiaceae bacterium]|nr:hypothetical protein [Hyphomicrobiaceae bacterium]